MKIFVKRPGKAPEEMEIKNTLRNWQELVGGYIETVTITDDFVLICNEEGLINDSKFNCWFMGMQFFGTIAFCGVEEDNFADVPIDYETFKRVMPNEWWEVEECK